MAELAPKVADRVNALIDSVIDQGECDFSQAISVPLPGTTFIDLLGLPQSQLSTLLYWKDVMTHHAELAGGVEAGEKLLAETVPTIFAYIYGVTADRRDKPADDLITRILQARIEGGRALSDNEIARTLFLMISAGLDTVSISLQCIFNYLATHPEARQMLVNEPDTTDNLIEELLRSESPVQALLRAATRDTEIGGCPVKAGEVFQVSIGAGNIDPAMPGADTVDVRRGDKRHLAFGAGPHRCLGSHLARMELRTVVREWHKRIPHYRLKAGYTPEWNSNFLRGVNHLMLEWDTDGTVRG
jgi:cytochrome P450